MQASVSRFPSTDDGQTRTIFIVMTMDEHYTKTSLAATLRQVELLDDRPVVREDGSGGIVDLMLSRLLPQPLADQREHLIVELKRPNVKIGSNEVTQIKDYVTATAKDERFRATNTRWEFWVLSTEMSEFVRLEVNQAGRPSGLLWHVPDLNLRIWVKTWGQIIDDCKARLQFFQERLNYLADESSGLEYLRRAHERYLPKEIAETGNVRNEESAG